MQRETKYFKMQSKGNYDWLPNHCGKDLGHHLAEMLTNSIAK